MAVNLRKGAPTSTNIDYNVARMSVLEYWTWCRLLGSSRTHRIHGSLARKSQVSECRKKKKKKKKKMWKLGLVPSYSRSRDPESGSRDRSPFGIDEEV